MTQISNITVKDGTLDVVFTAQMPQSGSIPAKWVNRSGARDLQKNLTAFVRPRTSNSLATDKTVVRFEMPVKDPVSGLLVRSYTAKLEVILPVTGTDVESTQFIGILLNLLAHVDIKDILINATPAV